ncbi:hypothetical protein Ancab_013494 [Ancistrocladus abbreviatus]
MPLEDLNGEAMQLEGTEGLVGSLSKAIAGCAGGDEECAGRSTQINDKTCLFDCKIGGSNYLVDLGLSVLGKGGEIQNFELGHRSADGSVLVVDESKELEAEEALGFVAGPSKLKEEIWMGLGKNSSQHKDAGKSGIKPLMSKQPSASSSSRIRKDRISSKSERSLSNNNKQKRKKVSQKKRRKKISWLRIASRSPTQQEDAWLYSDPKTEAIIMSGNNISDGGIKNMNRVFLCNALLEDAKAI